MQRDSPATSVVDQPGTELSERSEQQQNDGRRRGRTSVGSAGDTFVNQRFQEEEDGPAGSHGQRSQTSSLRGSDEAVHVTTLSVDAVLVLNDGAPSDAVPPVYSEAQLALERVSSTAALLNGELESVADSEQVELDAMGRGGSGNAQAGQGTLSAHDRGQGDLNDLVCVGIGGNERTSDSHDMAGTSDFNSIDTPNSGGDLSSRRAPNKCQNKWMEAAIYVAEGEDNEKFIHHPRGQWSKKAFEVLHHPAYYITHLIVTILLMLLALSENHPLPRDRQISGEAQLAIRLVSAVLEFILLVFIAVYMTLKFIWFGPRKFVTSKRAMLSVLILAVMLVEVVVVIARRESHLRVTRALRPIFFVDNVLMESVRRELRDIQKSLKPIVDVLFLLLFIVLMFALLGYYFLAGIDPSFFDSFQRSFISLYILMTTANNPDVMLESYLERPFTVIFFILYLIIAVYFIINMLTAVIYSSFSHAAMIKFKKLYLHKREALKLAYNVLAQSPEEGICFHDFLLFVQRFRPSLTKFDIMCIFKSLHKNHDHVEQHRPIKLDEFYGFYEALNMSWRQINEDGLPKWYEEMNIIKACRYPIKVCHKLVKSKLFNAIIYLVVFVNVIFFTIYTIAVDRGPSEDRFNKLWQIYPISFIFTLIYCVEIVLKIIGYGPHRYYRKPWNVIDSLVVFASMILLLMEIKRTFVFLAAARPIKLFRLLRLRHRYRDFLWTIAYLVPKMATVAIFLSIVNYSFAIVGMEFLDNRVFEGCCNTSWYNVRTFYTGNIQVNSNLTENVSPTADIYYLLNFDDIGSSYVTLFTLMIGNNWHVIMEGFASEARLSWLVRLYFLSFNIITLVIFEVAIAYIVEAFVYTVLTKQKHRYCRKHKNTFKYCQCAAGSDQRKKVRITLCQGDLDEIQNETNAQTKKFTVHFNLRRAKTQHANILCYIGHRLKSKVDVQLQMYEALLKEWIQEAEDREQARAEGTDGETVKSWKVVVLQKLKRIYNYITDDDV